MIKWVEAVRPEPSERQPRLTADLAHPKMFGAYPIAFQLQAIGDLAQRQAFVELQCCGGSVGYPVRLLIKRKGDMTFENLVKRLRCRRCGRSKPAPVYLVAGHHRTEQFGPDADGLSSSSRRHRRSRDHLADSRESHLERKKTALRQGNLEWGQHRARRKVSKEQYYCSS